MAFAETTLSTACAVGDTSIVVASATSVAAGRLVLIDGEMMQVAKDYVSGTTLNVYRGQNGTAQVAHVVTARVTHGLATDFGVPAPATVVNFPVAGRAREIRSMTTTGSIALPTAGNDLFLVLNGTSVIGVTIPVPTKDMDGTLLIIASNGAAAHTLTFTGGLSGAGTSYDVVTINATAPAALIAVAVNEVWLAPFGPAMGGTVTNLIGSVA